MKTASSRNPVGETEICKLIASLSYYLKNINIKLHYSFHHHHYHLLLLLWWCNHPHQALPSSVVHLQMMLSSAGFLHPVTFRSNKVSVWCYLPITTMVFPQVFFYEIFLSVLFLVFWYYPFGINDQLIVVICPLFHYSWPIQHFIELFIMS